MLLFLSRNPSLLHRLYPNSSKREDIREKKAKSGVLQGSRKIKANKRVF